MAEYIEREVAMNLVLNTSGDYATALCELRKLPAADVEPVVRCKDCKHHHNCEIEIAGMFGDNAFCVFGERKDNENATT